MEVKDSKQSEEQKKEELAADQKSDGDGEEVVAEDTKTKELNQFFIPDEKVKKWLMELVEKDIEKAKERNSNPLLLKVNNMAIIRRQQTLRNRVEFDTLFDFKTVEEILISEEVPCNFDQNLFYITVVLFGRNKKVPLVFPYCFRKIAEEDEQQMLKEKEALKSLDKNQKKRKMKKLKKKLEKNDLSQWVFVNSKGDEAEHNVKGYSKI